MVVTANGCFDGLHSGHFFFLGFCRGQGDRLIIGLNSDRYIIACKRPVPIPQEERRRALMETGIPYKVVIFDEDTPCDFIRRVMPDIHCIGEEYMGKAPEEKTCCAIRTKIVYVPRVGKWSSSAIRGRYEVSRTV